jgi:hypothetical protein
MADLLRMLHRPEYNIDEVLIAARDEGVAGYVDWALERMAALAPLPKNVVEARRAQPVRRDERWQASFYESHPRAAFLRDLVSGPRPHLRLIELVWPSQSFLDHMGRTHAQHLLRLGTPFRWQFEEEP